MYDYDITACTGGEFCDKFGEYVVDGVRLCNTHYKSAMTAKKRPERYCAHCDRMLEIWHPASRKYCSTHCKNNAQRERDGLPQHEFSGPRAIVDRLIEEATQVCLERYGKAPDQYSDDSIVMVRWREKCADRGIDPKTLLPIPKAHTPIQDLGH